MKLGLIKALLVVAGFSIILMLFLSVGVGKQPDYFLFAAEDNDLVEAYRSYFELTDTSVKKVKENNYNARILSKNTKYYELEQTTYSFDAHAYSSNPSKWEYTQNPDDKYTYDQNKLVKRLKNMQVYFTGDINIQIIEFDNYTVIEVRQIKDDVIVDVQTGLFKYNSMVELPEEITLKSLWKVYKLKK